MSCSIQRGLEGTVALPGTVLAIQTVEVMQPLPRLMHESVSAARVTIAAVLRCAL